MPRGGTFDSGDWGEHVLTGNGIPSSIYHPLIPFTDTVDFAYDDGIQSRRNGGDCLEKVTPPAANRSDGMAAPSVAVNGLGNVYDNFDNYFCDLNHQQQQQQLTLPATTNGSSKYRWDPTRLLSYQSHLCHSIPTPPDGPLYPALIPLGLPDEAKSSRTETAAQRRPIPPLASKEKASAQSSSRRKDIAGLQEKHMEERQQSNSLVGSIRSPPPDPVRRKGRPKKYHDPEPDAGVAASGMVQRDDDGREETLSKPKGGSLRSGTDSAHSLSSLDFNRLDQLGESMAAPGVLRLGARSASSNSQPSLPDEKGFSIQIGPEVFKLSGASIMSDGRFGVAARR